MSLIKIDVIKQIIKELPSPIKSNVMTAYDTLIQEGMKKGLEKGREEGREEGLEKSVLNLHKNDFPIQQIAHIMEISLDKVKSILKKNKRI